MVHTRARELHGTRKGCDLWLERGVGVAKHVRSGRTSPPPCALSTLIEGSLKQSKFIIAPKQHRSHTRGGPLLPARTDVTAPSSHSATATLRRGAATARGDSYPHRVLALSTRVEVGAGRVQTMADRRSKRAAPQGQWRTPPTPFFGTDAGTDALAELDTTGATAPSWSMPHPAGVGLPTAGEGDAEMGGTTSGGDDSGAMPPDGGMDTAVGVAAVGAAAVDSKDRKLEETVAAMAISDVRARGPAAFGSMYARASGAPPAAPRTHVAAPSPGSADDPGDIANMVRRMQQEEERRARR